MALCLAAGWVSAASATTIDHTTADYLTHCGGCHGIDGRSPHTFVPDLRDQVGTFLCSAEGRAYVVQVPGVTMSLIRDDQALADVLNLVIFRFGGARTPTGTAPYTAREVHELRAHPVQAESMLAYRSEVLQRARLACRT